jgi:hypothetical protein
LPFNSCKGGPDDNITESPFVGKKRSTAADLPDSSHLEVDASKELLVGTQETNTSVELPVPHSFH